LKNVIWNEFRLISEYIYIAPQYDCDEKEVGGAVLKAVGELRINCGWKGFTISLLLEASSTVICNVKLIE
jgi:hypothetical protein